MKRNSISIASFVATLLIGFMSATLCGGQESTSSNFPGPSGSFMQVLDERYPDDHSNYTESKYTSEAERTIKASQLAIAQIMVLDEVLQAVEDDQACSQFHTRGSRDYEQCVAELYMLPDLLQDLNIGSECPVNLRIQGRVDCLLLTEIHIRNRRHLMQSHPTWTKKEFELEKTFSKMWRTSGQPDVSQWHSIPEAVEIARLDSLHLYVHALSLATAIQAAALYSDILMRGDPFVLGSKADPTSARNAMVNRNSQIRSAMNRMKTYGRIEPGVKFGKTYGGDIWKQYFIRWISEARSAKGDYGMVLARPENFNLIQPPAVELPDLLDTDNDSGKEHTEANRKGDKNNKASATKPQAVLWVPGGIPIHLPQQDFYLSIVKDNGVKTPPAKHRPAPVSSSEPIAGSLQEAYERRDWPAIVLPLAASECELRWQPLLCEKTTEADVVAYVAKGVNDAVGLPATVASAIPFEQIEIGNSSGPIRFIKKGTNLLIVGAKKGVSLTTRFLTVLNVLEIDAHMKNNDPASAVDAFFRTIAPVFTSNPRYRADVENFKRSYQRYRNEKLALLRISETLQCGLREVERNIIATQIIQEHQL